MQLWMDNIQFTDKALTLSRVGSLIIRLNCHKYHTTFITYLLTEAVLQSASSNVVYIKIICCGKN